VQIRVRQVRERQVGVGEVGVIEVGVGEVRVGQVGVRQIGVVGQNRSVQVGVTGPDVAQVGASRCARSSLAARRSARERSASARYA
jgi:hypothetical protein